MVSRCFVIPVVCYLVAVIALMLGIGAYPEFPYNWESYTAWNVMTFWAGPERAPGAILALTDGLMTDSGRGPLVALPVELGFALDGVGLAAMRWPVAMVTALAAPLTWAVGRRLTPGPVAMVAALLLAVSPVFVLYGRTATIVGISLVPVLLTALALVCLLEAADGVRALAWGVALQVCLVASAYAYAPVRLLWPLAVVVLLAAVVVAAGPVRRRYVLAAVATVGVLPVALVTIGWLTAGVWDPAATVAGYFQARGEQIFSMSESPEQLQTYLREAPGSVAGNLELTARLIGQNGVDLARLLTDWQTEPTVAQYWNPRGRLWPAVLVPGFWLGLGGLVVTGIWRRSWRALLLLAIVLGLTVPLLLTTKVHVGRLVPVLPFLLLVVASGCGVAAGLLGRLAGMVRASRAEPVQRMALAGLGTVVVLASAIGTLVGYQHLPESDAIARQGERIAALLDEVAGRGGAAVVAPADWGLPIEGVRAGAYWLELNQMYRVVDLTQPEAEAAAGDDRPPLYMVGVAPHLRSGDLPNACRNLYLVLPEAEAEFFQAVRRPRIRRLCPDGLEIEVLPG